MRQNNIPYIHLFLSLAVPGSVMFAARYVGQGPSETKAGEAASQVPEVIEFPEVCLSGAVHDGSEQEEHGTIKSPFWFDQATAVEGPIGLANLLPGPEAEIQEEFFDGYLSSILPHPRTPMAIINSKPCRIGDELEGGWKLVAINGDDRTVTLMSKSGKRIVVELTKNP